MLQEKVGGASKIILVMYPYIKKIILPTLVSAVGFGGKGGGKDFDPRKGFIGAEGDFFDDSVIIGDEGNWGKLVSPLLSKNIIT